MPKFFSNILDKLFPERVEFREGEKERAAARAARKEEHNKAKEERYRVLERLNNQSDNAKKKEEVNEDELANQIARELSWVKKAVLGSSYHPINTQCVEGQSRMYEIEIAPPRMFTRLKTYVYAYVECRDCEHSATVFLYIPAMLGQEEQFKAIAFYNEETIHLTEDSTIEIAWRIFAPLLEDLAA